MSQGVGTAARLELPQILDLQFQGVPGVIGSFLLQTHDEIGLIETGPASTLPNLLAALEPFGGLEKLTSVAVTHIHLDHAGAVGKLLDMAPHVRCYVHEKGRRHLVDPSRLLRSATMIYGDQMGPLWGEVVAAAEERVVAVEDGDRICLGGVDLDVVYTPGHAVHHMVLHDPANGRVFTGDAAGVRLEGVDQVRPPAPPPDLDPETWKESVRKIRDLQPRELWLTHYGPFRDDINRHLDDLVVRLDAWIELVRRSREAGQDAVTIVDTLQRLGDTELIAEGGTSETLRQYMLASPWGMTVYGILHYLDKSG